MKKYMFGLIALVIATASVAFTKQTRFVDYYWAFNAQGTALIYPNTPPPTTNPVSCSGAQDINCAQSHTAYFQDTDGLYKPVSGTLVTTFKKPE